jgi:hypothetical protein
MGKLTMRDRITEVFRGEMPDRPPFIDRMELWYKSKCRQGTLQMKKLDSNP